MIWVPLLVLAGIIAGPPLARIQSAVPRRGIAWLWLAGLIAAVNFALIDYDPLLRMVGICCVLLAAMKGLVYAEWARTERLSVAHYLVFATCWFGMDPASFRERRSSLSWRGDVVIGLILTAVGLLGCWVVWNQQWLWLLAMFVPLSLAFHFGILRLMKAALRACGYPVRTLFPNVLKARGIGDFWGRRWNVGYSQMMQRLVGRPVTKLAGESAGIMAVFIGSGVLHELAITLPVRSGYGMPTLYFTLHGLMTALERKTGRRTGKLPALLLVALPVGLLFPEEFKDQVMIEVLRWFECFPLVIPAVSA